MRSFNYKPLVGAICFVAVFTTCNSNCMTSELDRRPANGRSKVTSPFDIARAYHYRHLEFNYDADDDAPSEIVRTCEIWALKGVGRRCEISQDSGLVSVTVDTPRWRFAHDLRRNSVLVTPSRLLTPENQRSDDYFWLTRTREFIVPFSKRFAAKVAIEEVKLDDQRVERVIAYYPPDPFADRFNIQLFDENAKRRTDKLWSRQYWFELDTGRLVQRKCGCKRATKEIRIDYPDPSTMDANLFSFKVPKTARLEVRDPALGRTLKD